MAFLLSSAPLATALFSGCSLSLKLPFKVLRLSLRSASVLKTLAHVHIFPSDLSPRPSETAGNVDSARSEPELWPAKLNAFETNPLSFSPYRFWFRVQRRPTSSRISRWTKASAFWPICISTQPAALRSLHRPTRYAPNFESSKMLPSPS